MSSSKNKSALQEKESDSHSNLSAISAERIKSLRREKKDINALIQGVLKGNKTALSQAITLIEVEVKGMLMI